MHFPHSDGEAFSWEYTDVDKRPLGIHYYLWSNTKSNIKCIPWRVFQFCFYLETVTVLISYIFYCYFPYSTYGCMLAQESTLSIVIQYKTIPFILPGEIAFPKLSLSQTFTNTELTQPHFSLSLSLYPCLGLFLSQAFRSHVSYVEWSGPCKRSVLVSIAPREKHKVWVQQLDPILDTRQKHSIAFQACCSRL